MMAIIASSLIDDPSDCSARARSIGVHVGGILGYNHQIWRLNTSEAGANGFGLTLCTFDFVSNAP